MKVPSTRPGAQDGGLVDTVDTVLQCCKFLSIFYHSEYVDPYYAVYKPGGFKAQWNLGPMDSSPIQQLLYIFYFSVEK